MVVLMVLGLFAYFQLGQDEDPPFTFRAMVVQAYWPGATAQQVAEQVTDKIERTLQEVPYADTIRSYTKPGESLTLFQVKDSTPPKEVSEAWYQVRKKIGDMAPTLPQGVQGPFFNDEFGDVYGSIFALSADGFSDEELRVFAEDVRSRLLRCPCGQGGAVRRAGREGQGRDLARRLAQLGLDMGQVVSQLNAQNAVQAAGVVDTGSRNVQIRVQGALDSIDALRQMPIRAVNPTTGAASTIKLGDIADIHRGYVDPPTTLVRFQGHQVVALGVSMAKGGDIIALGKALQKEVKALQAELPVGVTLAQIQNQPEAVATRSTSSSMC
jgi:multidrug efflux pump subunit AcrB